MLQGSHTKQISFVDLSRDQLFSVSRLLGRFGMFDLEILL
jgi:hypothetical protein